MTNNETVFKMQRLAEIINIVLNDVNVDPEFGFVLMVFKPGENGKEATCEYISNGDKESVIALLKEQSQRMDN